MKIKNIYKAILIYVLALALIIFSGNIPLKNKLKSLRKDLKSKISSQGENKENKAATVVSNKECTMKIFIHGTLLMYPSFRAIKATLKGQRNSSKKNKKRTFAQKYLDNLRKGGIYKSQLINDKGLIPVNLEEDKTTLNRIVALYKKNNNTYEVDKNNLYYTFGWSGRLDQKERILWGDKLYKAICKELNIIKQRHNYDKINVEILSHSHGGNVALNLARAEEKYKNNLSIEKLTLLGTPIQSETAFLINSPVFKRIYHVYSTGDNVQVVDIISTKDNFSRRRFKVEKNNDKGKRSSLKNIPDKLVQIEVRCGKIKPMHTELWFMSTKSTPIKRKSFPLYPYPVVAFMPLIENSIEKSFSQNKNVLVNIEKIKDELKFHITNVDPPKEETFYLANFSLNPHL